MKCAAFEDWLDQGRGEARAAEAAFHAAGCPACAALLRADESIDRALASLSLWAPARFTDRVMARVGPPMAAPALPALPWWTRAATEPATVAALVAGGVLAWGWDGLWGLALVVGSWSGAAPPAASGRLDPSAVLAIQVALGSLLALSAPAIARAAARLPLTRA